MTDVAAKVLATVNAPYGAWLDARELAARIVDPASASAFHGPVFSFFSEVSPRLQEAFVAEMGLDRAVVREVARAFGGKAGYGMALAA